MFIKYTKKRKKRKKEKKRKERRGETVDEDNEFHPYDEIKMNYTNDNINEVKWVDHTFLNKNARGASAEEVHRRMDYLKLRKGPEVFAKVKAELENGLKSAKDVGKTILNNILVHHAKQEGILTEFDRGLKVSSIKQLN